MNNKTYQTLDQQLINTGGNCMVLVTVVLQKELKSTIYVFTNEEFVVLSTVDYMSYDIGDDVEEGKYIITEHLLYEISDVRNDDDKELYSYCFQSYIQQMYAINKHYWYLTFEQLPIALQEQVDDKYKQWLEDNNQLIETDGTTVIIHDRYLDALAETDPVVLELKGINDFIEYLEGLTDSHHDMEEIELLYDDYIDITFHEKTIKIRFGAVPYNELIDFLKTVVTEY